MKKLTFLIISFILSLLISCKDNSTEPDNTPDVEISGSTYSNKILGIKLNAPENWILKKDVVIDQYEAVLFGSRSGTVGSRPSFSIIKQDVTTELDGETILSLISESLTQMFPGIEFDSKRTVMIDGFDCAEVVYSYNFNGIYLKQKQIMFMCNNSKLLVFTFDSEMTNYESNKADFESIQNSIKKL
jgi:hypothetical protein